MDTRQSEVQIEGLLAHAGWLAALARRLVRDPASADDLVQDTWCAALRAPAVEVADARAWLATLVKNLARARARSERARHQRERDAAQDAAVEPADALVERAEAQRRLLAALLALDEPYRGTLLARYVEGRTPAAIARRTGTLESTVRTRLARGHERLRARLERDLGEGWALALAPLTALAPMAVGPANTAGAAQSGAGISAGGLGIGAWVMGTSMKVALVATVGGLCAWWLLRQGTPSLRETQPARAETATEQPLERESVALASAAAPGERVAVVVDEPAAPASTEAAAAAPVLTGWLELQVLRDGAPWPGVGVWIAEEKAWPMLECLDVAAQPPDGALFALTDAAGVAAFRGISDWTHTVGLDTTRPPVHPTRFVTSALHAGYRHVIALGSAVVRGTVYDPDGLPRVGAGVQVGHERPNGQHLVIAAMTRTDERGEYVIADVPAAVHLAVMELDGRFDGRGAVERVRVTVAQGGEHQVDFGSPRGSPRWSGRVLNAFDEPFPGTGRLRLRQERTGEERWAPIDELGRFAVAFTAGTWELVVHATGSSGVGFELGLHELPDQDLERDVTVPGARLMGRVIEQAGGAVRRGLQVSVRPKGHDYPAAFRTVHSDGDGAFVIDGLEPGAWTVAVYPGRLVGGDTTEIVLAPGERLVRLELHWTAGSRRN